MRRRLPLVLLTCAMLSAFHASAQSDAGIRQEQVQFAKGASSATIEGDLKGDADVDYVVRAAAGQTLTVKLQKSNLQNYFNVMPPGSVGGAMFVGTASDEYSGVLPDDGDYVVRVYLMRPAARRNESSHYTLTIGVTGSALAPTAASKDALVKGTRYHATAQVQCVPAYETGSRACDVNVVRRGFDGTATLDFPSKSGTRSILFVKGRPVASNAAEMDTMSFERQDDNTIVRLGDSERYVIPDALITGG